MYIWQMKLKINIQNKLYLKAEPSAKTKTKHRNPSLPTTHSKLNFLLQHNSYLFLTI